MRLFLALGAVANWVMDTINDEKPPNMLVSFEYKEALDRLTYQPEMVIVDSGAFSAWNAGRPTDIHAYADWALSQQQRFPKFAAVNMDVIPGQVGRDSTKKERLVGMAQSIKNADWLRDQGLSVMEVFHQDEPLSFLEDLLDRLPEGDILCLSPRNDVSTARKVTWHRHLLGYFYRRFGTNIPKTHGLAVTSKPILRAFPYYSGDSTSWISVQRYGAYMSETGSLKRVDTRVPAEMSRYKPTLQYMQVESIRNSLLLGRDVTTLWENRGIRWED